MKIAIVHDDLCQFGGAERFVLQLRKLFGKDTPLYTSIGNELVANEFKNTNIQYSFLQKSSLFRRFSQPLFFLYPIAFESFNFDGFDVVISSSSRFAHGIITPVDTIHICYMHSPSRYVWDYNDYIKKKRLSSFQRFFLPYIVSYLRVWDLAASRRPDFFIANSIYTQKRIKKFYSLDSEVIYPPVDIARFLNLPLQDEGFYLYVGRVVPWKRIDNLIDVFNKNQKNLYIAGNGDRGFIQFLKKRSENNIKFIENLSDLDISSLYSKCHAVVFPSKEDFGIVPVEAQASGKGVIAYSGGGASETVINGKTGILYNSQSASSLDKAIENFEKIKIDPRDCRYNSKNFSIENFKSAISNFVNLKINEKRKYSNSM